MESYAIIERLAFRDAGIDWSCMRGVVSSYEKAQKEFADIKKEMLQSMSDYSKRIIKNEEDIFCVQHIADGLSPAYIYLKIVSLC